MLTLVIQSVSAMSHGLYLFIIYYCFVWHPNSHVCINHMIEVGGYAACSAGSEIQHELDDRPSWSEQLTFLKRICGHECSTCLYKTHREWPFVTLSFQEMSPLQLFKLIPLILG